MGCAVFVVGPAGSGKTTLAGVLREHNAGLKRKVHLVNLDPAQALEELEFDFDIRNHIEISEIMEEADFGPNGGLLAGLGAVAENLDVMELPEEEDAYLIFDCPGQIELYVHDDSVKKIVEAVGQHHTVGMIYALDSTHALDSARFLSGALSATVAMAKFEVPHINVLTKCDLLDEEDVEEFVQGLEIENICENLSSRSEQEEKFNRSLAKIVENNGFLGFIPLDLKKEESVEGLAYQIDMCIQYYDSCNVEDDG